MNWKPLLALAVCLAFLPSLTAKCSAQAGPPQNASSVISQVDSPLMPQISPDGQALIRVRILGREFDGRHSDQMKQRIEDTLQSLGYFKARISNVTLEPLGDGRPTPLRLNFTGDLGSVYRFQGVQWKNVRVLPVNQLAQLVPMQDGDVFDTGKVRELLEGLYRLYAAHGYKQFNVVPLTIVDQQTHSIQLVLDLAEGTLESRR